MSDFRYDFMKTSASSKLDLNGFLRITGTAAKVGILKYNNHDGSVRAELVTKEALADEEALEQLKGLPVTLTHPEDEVTSLDASKYAKGSVTDAYFEDDQLKIALVVTDQEAIDSISAGVQQLSPGYKVELEYTSGTFKDEKYDVIQKKRYYNHVAIVPMARGGADCKIKLDSKGGKMPTVKLSSGATLEVPDAATATAIQGDINALTQRLDSTVPKDDLSALQGKHDALQSELSELKKQGDKRIDAASIEQYLDTVELAKKLKPEIVIKKDSGDFKTPQELLSEACGVEGKDMAYLQGRADAMLDLVTEERIKQQKTSLNLDHGSNTDYISPRQQFMQNQTKKGNS